VGDIRVTRMRVPLHSMCSFTGSPAYKGITTCHKPVTKSRLYEYP
jgi:hypothetical protein